MSDVASCLTQLSALLFQSKGSTLEKPLTAPSLGFGELLIVSHPDVRGGLHVASYYVMQRESRTVLGTGNTIAAALEQSRRFIAVDRAGVEDAIEQMRIFVPGQIKAWADHRNAQIESSRSRQVEVKASAIPKRRQQIFDKSEGKCHYCGVALKLRGKWHIEHMHPRALMGSDEPGNLVASCVPCNLKKKDRTAEEFMADPA